MSKRHTPRPAVAQATNMGDPAHAPGKQHLVRDTTDTERRELEQQQRFEQARGPAGSDTTRSKRMRRGRG